MALSLYTYLNMFHLEEIQTLHLAKIEKLMDQTREGHREILEASEAFKRSLVADLDG